MAMAMRPGSASGRSLAQQKHQVKRGLAATPQLGQIWQPLAISWFESWKEYVDFDNKSDDERAQEVRVIYIFLVHLSIGISSRDLAEHFFYPLIIHIKFFARSENA
jgi:hypothetical protein